MQGYPPCPARMSSAVSDPAGPPRESRAVFLSLMASGVIWGLIWWPLKYFAGYGLGGSTIGLTAYALVAAVSLPLIWRQRLLWWPERRLLLAIGLSFGIANFAFTSAMMMGSVVRAMLLFYLLPAWGAIGGWLFLRERLVRRRLLAVALSLSGVAVILGGANMWKTPLSLADGMALVAGLAYTGAAIANRKAQAIPIVSRTLIAFPGCTLLALVAIPISRPVFPSLHAATWGWLLAFGFVWLLGGSLLTTYGVTRVQASRAAILQVVELLVAVVSAVLLNGETLRLQDCVGGAMIIVATVIEAANVS